MGNKKNGSASVSSSLTENVWVTGGVALPGRVEKPIFGDGFVEYLWGKTAEILSHPLLNFPHPSLLS
jgi:hypothetical protein